MGDGIPGVAYFEQVLKMLLEEIIRFPFHSFNWPIVVYKVWFRTFFTVLYSSFRRGMLHDFYAKIVRLNDENLF